MKVDLNYASSTLADQARMRTAAQKIVPQDSDPAQVQQDGATARVPPAAHLSRSVGATARVSDTTTLSGTTDLVDQLATLVNSSPEVRQDRVQALRDAIGQGTYQISADRIADAMLAQATSKLR